MILKEKIERKKKFEMLNECLKINLSIRIYINVVYIPKD
jgi:hypothetical protein